MKSSKVPSAAARLAIIREEISDGALRLAYHAAVPVVIDATLLNLLRVNFFLDPPDAVPYETEAVLLMSPLFREIGEELYEIQPDIRNLLLTGLYTRYGAERVRRVGLLLEQYTDATLAWHSQPELERAQQLAALSFVDPTRASQWLESAGSGSTLQALGREWYVAMHHRITEQSTVTTATEEIARTLAQLTDQNRQIRGNAIRALAALTNLPEADSAPVVAALAKFVREGTIRSEERITPDIQAALSLIGTLPHDKLDFREVTLIGADLRGLNFSGTRFNNTRLIDFHATNIDLTSANLQGAEIKDAVMDGARLDHANLRSAMLERVSLSSATLVGANMDKIWMQDVDFSRADLREIRLSISDTDNVRLDDAVVDEASIEVKAQPSEALAEGAPDLETAYQQGIFISYRREETAFPASWLFDRLVTRFGRDQVFKDVDSIQPGESFVERITTAAGSSLVLLALIGGRWLTIAGQDGRPRLDDPRDLVRLEIEAALARNVRVIPILVDGARMPRAEELPAGLAKLAYRQALELRANRLDDDGQRLLRVLDWAIAEAQEQARLEAERTAEQPRQLQDPAQSDTGELVREGFLALERGDADEARRWFLRAIDAGDSDGMLGLGIVVLDQGNLEEAKQWFLRAADAGNSDGMDSLGVLARDRGDTDEAKRWFRKAAEAGNSDGRWSAWACSRWIGEMPARPNGGSVRRRRPGQL